LWIFLAVFLFTLPAEFVANDRPLLIKYDGGYYFPVLKSYPETAFGGDFETEAEYREPEVQELTSRRQVIQLAIHGPASERTLKELANRIKDDLTALALISYVRIDGVRDYEIAIEVSEATLRAYGLRLSDISAAVRRGSLDLPGGSVETQGEEILIRTKGQNYTARDFEEIIVLARPNGATIRLGDLATVRDGFEDADLITRFEGEPAALVSVFRTSDERVLDIVEEINGYLGTLRSTLPEGITVDVWQNQGRLLQSRLDLLIRNGRLGLLLVVLALALFLNIRLAFWTSIGLFLSFIGVFAVMVYLGVSVNLLSLFAFILAIGIVVDDAIVIGENIFAEQERGTPPLEAAIKGATRLLVPVSFAVLTTIVAFSPLLFVPGQIGKFMRNIPIIVIAVLVFSLIESLFILPAHLSHIKVNSDKKPNPILARIERVQNAFSRLLRRFIEGPLDRALRFSVQHYGLVIVSAISMILLSVGLVAGGLIKFSFFPDIEGENVIARIEMPQGTTAEQTQRVAAFIETMGRETIAELQAMLPDDHPPLVKNVFSIVGEQPSLSAAPFGGDLANLIESNLAEVNFELLAAEERDLSAVAFEQAWREKVGVLPGVKSLAFQSAIFSLGSPIQAELSAPTPAMLDQAIERFKDELSQYAGVFDVEDDQELGKREVQLSLLPQARTLGVSLDDMARQVRSAFYGDEALRIQRGRDDIRVMVRLPKDERNALSDLQNLRIRTPSGAQIPLAEVAEATFGFGPSTIQRRDRRRVTTVTAEVDEDLVSADDVIGSLEADIIPAMQQDYPGLRVSFEGEQQQQTAAFGALGRGFVIALFIIYMLLAIPFRSYIQPFIIMAAIPFGFIGAVLGHLLMGLNMSILSLIGIIGLSGVVVNDALVLIDFINERRRSGIPMAEAIREAGKVRFRPIVLTSLTTFLGVLPLILEKSLQAQFLIPMAVSLGFGILFATAILMLLVPALTMLDYKVEQFLRRTLHLDPSESDGLPQEEVSLVAPSTAG
ncbi:MAG: efflux RND transporter permease subunit, partial [Bacteroidetes bacterium]|nr:efflux RND transporter permease subunit [Bacteroidota bacterium]